MLSKAEIDTKSIEIGFGEEKRSGVNDPLLQEYVWRIPEAALSGPA